MEKFRLDERTLTLMQRMWRDYMRRYLGRLSLAIFCMAVVGASSGAIIYLTEITLDKALIDRNERMIWLVAGGFVVVALARGFGNLGQTTLMQSIGLRIIQRLQGQMFHALQQADIQFLHDAGTARQISRFTNDVHYLRDTITKVFTGAGRDILVLVVLVGQMFWLNWQLALVAFVVFPISVMPVLRIGRRLRRVSANTQSAYGQMTSVLDDSLKGARQVRAYRMQDYEQERAEGCFDALYRLTFKAAWVRALTYPLLDGLAGTALAGILAWGGYEILAGTMTVGQFMAFFIAVVSAYQPMRSLANLNASLQEGLAAAQRIFSIIDYEPRIREHPKAIAKPPGKGHIRLDGVRFSYAGHTAPGPTLNGVDIDVPAGTTVALVGPSGAGKSTILNLIARFYDVDQGRVMIDGHDVRRLGIDSLMANIGLISQETGLFNDSVRANIAYGRFGAGEDEVIAAAKAAHADGFIRDLPDGYDTQVGEMGVRLSGGQRQRIAIARAMLKNAAILLLDEATSALDTQSERHVQQALQQLMRGRTCVVIAHRLSTITHADRIYVLDKGGVVEQGSHEELLGQDGLYARLCRMQFHGAGDGSDGSDEGEAGEEKQEPPPAAARHALTAPAGE